ncbi:hypothetical protein C8R46DRAFT_962904 [Mycena filopes]|nr:hypothetical protein C8R46DRAFT_962904 [Mycena filopes]
MLKRHFLDMDELVEKWTNLGDKTQLKPPASNKSKRGVSRKKALTVEEEIARTEIAIGNRIKGEEEEALLAPVTKSFEDAVPSDGGEVLDERSLCPFCDLPLPVDPTQTLIAMLAAAQVKSVPEFRPDNSAGRRVNFSDMAIVCSRHNFETDLLPMAIERGWPTQLNLPDIERRLKEKKPIFEALINDWDLGEAGLRFGNLFWTEAVVFSAKGNGGIAGSITNFHRTQPGYYGESGTRTIDQALRRMLVISQEAALPLTPEQFYYLVLIPEAGLQLIIEDLGAGTSRDHATQAMFDSGSYGAQMFPDDDT